MNDTRLKDPLRTEVWLSSGTSRVMLVNRPADLRSLHCRVFIKRATSTLIAGWALANLAYALFQALRDQLLKQPQRGGLRAVFDPVATSGARAGYEESDADT